MKPVIVTTSWDDGHKLDLKLAEILKKHGISGTFYISPEDAEIAAKDRLADDEIRILARDFEIGAHTMTHPHLTKIPDDEAKQEITSSKKKLEETIKKPITSFCYPAGFYTPRHIVMAQGAGFTYARTVQRFETNVANAFEAPTTIHAYRHWSDAWQIAKVAKFLPWRFVNLLINWDLLAIILFENTKLAGGTFHLWGHSWEIDANQDWARLERVLQYISRQSGVTYLTNGETS